MLQVLASQFAEIYQDLSKESIQKAPSWLLWTLEVKIGAQHVIPILYKVCMSEDAS